MNSNGFVTPPVFTVDLQSFLVLTATQPKPCCVLKEFKAIADLIRLEERSEIRASYFKGVGRAMSTGSRLFGGVEIPEGMSRSAFKKVMKERKMEAEREQYVQNRREKRRLFRKQHKRRRPKLPFQQEFSNVTVVLDCGFDDLMEEGERVSLAGQLTRCYSHNRRCPRPVDVVVSCFTGKLRSRFETELRGSHRLWADIISFTEQDHIPEDPASAVYLTGDAKDVLENLEEGFTYYVGGIVDRDRYRNLCLNKAKALGIRTARLPIDEHIRVSGRRILTTNQAFELLLKWLELRDWKAAFEAVIPSRKISMETEVKSHFQEKNGSTKKSAENQATEEKATNSKLE